MAFPQKLCGNSSRDVRVVHKIFNRARSLMSSDRERIRVLTSTAGRGSITMVSKGIGLCDWALKVGELVELSLTELILP